MSPMPKTGKESVMDEPRIPESREPRNPIAAHDSPKAEDNFVALLGRGIDRIAEIQKHSIDVATQHNAEVMDVYNKTMQKLPRACRPPVVELANTMFARFSDAQKRAIDLAVEQSHTWIDTVKDGASNAEKATESAIQRSKLAMENTVDAQKKVMETAVAGGKAVMEATRQQIGLTEAPADAVVNSFQKGVDTFVEAQKDILDMVAAR